MKKILLLLCLMTIHIVSNACEVCKKQQPKVLRGITHGAGPESDWDYVVIGGAVLVVMGSLFYAIKWIIRPGEKESKHIKYSILNSD